MPTERRHGPTPPSAPVMEAMLLRRGPCLQQLTYIRCASGIAMVRREVLQVRTLHQEVLIFLGLTHSKHEGYENGGPKHDNGYERHPRAARRTGSRRLPTPTARRRASG